MPSTVLDLRAIALTGIAAGLAGAALLGVALSAAGVRAPTRTAALEFGALFAAIAVAWAIGYAYLAATRPQLNGSPYISGIVFGGVVYVVTQIALYGIAAEQTHTAAQVGFGLAATCLLYGLPVAILTRSLSKKSP